MIKLVPDLGAPVLVTGIDLGTQKYAPTWNEWASYIMAGGAYIVSGLGLAKGDAAEFIKNMGIAALPLAARHISQHMGITQPVSRRAAASVSRLAFRAAPAAPAARATPVSRSYQPEFEAVSPHAF